MSKRPHPNQFTPLATFPRPTPRTTNDMSVPYQEPRREPPAPQPSRKPTPRTTPGQTYEVIVMGSLATRHRPTADVLAQQVKEDLEALGFDHVAVNVRLRDGQR